MPSVDVVLYMLWPVVLAVVIVLVVVVIYLYE